ncbi:hypothetical protein M0813_20937 [Anaeramoeba flamelloides]|uniref:Uncharacterized protein n=1 Tax=Anaeramoeba flamelloides TaxID=1746091 RepID=A0ABQ8YJR7_9EUKA|nr:hypothetical protein M0813_20937 [Anaeramoeba flamelloides]
MILKSKKLIIFASLSDFLCSIVLFLLSGERTNFVLGGDGTFDLVLFSFFRSLAFLLLYGCSIRRGPWIAIILLIFSVIVGIVKSTDLSGHNPTEYLFEYCLLAFNFLFSVMELWIVTLSNRRSIEEEISTIFPFSETQQEDRQNLISRSKRNEKYNMCKMLEGNKKNRLTKKLFSRHKKRGMYESYILRGTDPQGLNSFRISFTITKPYKRPEDSFAQINGILFLQDQKIKTSLKNNNTNDNDNDINNDNESDFNDPKLTKLKTIIFKQDFDLKKVKFLKRKFQITIDKSKITCGAATGIISAKENASNSLSKEITNKQLFQPIYNDIEFNTTQIRKNISTPSITLDLEDKEEFRHNNKSGNKNIKNNDDDTSEEEDKNQEIKKMNNSIKNGDKSPMIRENSRSSSEREKNTPTENFFSFDLSFTVDQKPQLIISNDLLSEKIHSSPLKSVLTIPYPKCEFGGSISYNHNNETKNLDLDGWIGCQEHHWGKEYPKKQCYCVLNGGFSSDPDASCAILQTEYKVGCQIKRLLMFVIRVSGIEIRLNSLYRGVKGYTRSKFHKDEFIWDFWTESQFDEYEGRLIAKRKNFLNTYALGPKNSTRKIMITTKAKIEIKVTNKKRNITEFLDSNFGNFLEICVNEHDF